jgi:hypothetical protein
LDTWSMIMLWLKHSTGAMNSFLLFFQTAAKSGASTMSLLLDIIQWRNGWLGPCSTFNDSIEINERLLVRIQVLDILISSSNHPNKSCVFLISKQILFSWSQSTKAKWGVDHCISIFNFDILTNLGCNGTPFQS